MRVAGQYDHTGLLGGEALPLPEVVANFTTAEIDLALVRLLLHILWVLVVDHVAVANLSYGSRRSASNPPQRPPTPTPTPTPTCSSNNRDPVNCLQTVSYKNRFHCNGGGIRRHLQPPFLPRLPRDRPTTVSSCFGSAMVLCAEDSGGRESCGRWRQSVVQHQCDHAVRLDRTVARCFGTPRRVCQAHDGHNAGEGFSGAVRTQKNVEMKRRQLAWGLVAATSRTIFAILREPPVARFIIPPVLPLASYGRPAPQRLGICARKPTSLVQATKKPQKRSCGCRCYARRTALLPPFFQTQPALRSPTYQQSATSWWKTRRRRARGGVWGRGGTLGGW